MLRIQSVLCMSLFISSPGVLGVEFHFDCELRDGSSDNPEHGQLVLIANVERLPTEALVISTTFMRLDYKARFLGEGRFLPDSGTGKPRVHGLSRK